MGKTNHADHQTQGDVIVDRLASATVPATLKKHVTDFKSAHSALAAASRATQAPRADRDLALAAVGAADDTLDAAVNLLADKMVGAQMGSRKNPFAGFSKLAPSDLTALAYADEVKEVVALVAKVKKAQPAADVAKAAAACEKQASAVTSALAKLSKPQLAYTKSLAARDALLPAWTKALNKLKRNAAAAWFEDQATYKAVFAPPERVQAPVHKRAKKAKAGSAGSAGNGATSPNAAPAPSPAATTKAATT